VYGRIERFEGTEANRLDASDDELRRRVMGKRRGEGPNVEPPQATGALSGHADDGVPVDEWLRPPPP
jgi:hypothetical protein